MRIESVVYIRYYTTYGLVDPTSESMDMTLSCVIIVIIIT